jgi:hypothetical protein
MSAETSSFMQSNSVSHVSFALGSTNKRSFSKQTWLAMMQVQDSFQRKNELQE